MDIKFPSGGSVSLSEATGVLPVANGGTGVTGSTGTGATVLSTSPTLVTPNIGVATGTSLAAALNGSLGATTPSTVAATTISATSTAQLNGGISIITGNGVANNIYSLQTGNSEWGMGQLASDSTLYITNQTGSQALGYAPQSIAISSSGAVTVPSLAVTGAISQTSAAISINNASAGINFGSGATEQIYRSGSALGVYVASTTVSSFSATGLAVTGAITATGNITAYYSDDRLKTKLGDIENALDKVLSLDGFYDEANETAQALGYKAVREVGVSAQSVEKVLPELIKPAPIDPQYKTLDYARLVPLLIEAIKEQQGQINELKSRLGK